MQVGERLLITKRLLTRLKQSDGLQVALDVWESEPQINTELLDLVSLATPHIAGYSDEGKIRGTSMLYEAICKLYLEDKSYRQINILINDQKVSLEATGKELKSTFT
jgi:phosphoglycerate dehydrogenase-like enzyme